MCGSKSKEDVLRFFLTTFLEKKVSEEAARIPSFLILRDKVGLEERDRRVNAPLLPERARISKEGRRKKDKRGKGEIGGRKRRRERGKNEKYI